MLHPEHSRAQRKAISQVCLCDPQMCGLRHNHQCGENKLGQLVLLQLPRCEREQKWYPPE